jgi:hypothetical protein
MIMRSSTAAGRYGTVQYGWMAVLALSVAAGCAQTRQSRSVEPSGFLGDYSQLREGTGDEAQLVYINPAADFSRYDKVMIDSVAMWAREESKFSELSAEERQALTDYFYRALHTRLGEDYQIVSAPGPGVMRLRAAVTEADDANVTLNVVTTVVPQLRLLTSLGGWATDTAVIVGAAGLEAELTDSVTRERLAAAVDRRVGTKTLRGMFSNWSDVEQAFDYWAERFKKRLAEERGGKKPS